MAKEKIIIEIVFEPTNEITRQYVLTEGLVPIAERNSEGINTFPNQFHFEGKLFPFVTDVNIIEYK